MERTKKQKIFAWVAVSISALFTNLWAFWGIVENFHEGWYFKSVWRNIVLMFGQYLLIPILFMILAYISVRWHRIGAILHIILILGLVFLFGGTTVAILFIYLPLVGLAALYWYGKLDKKKLAYYLVVVLPLFIIFVFGAANGFRVAERVNDNNFGSRQIKGNGVELIWVTEGPGWPNSGITWFEAKNICARLSEDGKTISDSVLNIST